MLIRELTKLKDARRTPKRTCLKVDKLTEQPMFWIVLFTVSPHVLVKDESSSASR